MIRGINPVLLEMNRSPAPSLIPLDLASEWFSLSPDYLRGLIRSGRVRSERIKGKWYVSPDDVEAATPALQDQDR
jgi:hypothetical protein